MSSLKCGNCGLVNFASESVCKRCKSALAEGASPATASVASFPEEQSTGGVWQDKKKVVKHIDAPLPDRCVKCNSPQDVAWKAYTLKYYPAYNIVLALLGFVRYLNVGVEIGLCGTHRAKQKQKMTWGGVMIAASIGLFALAFVLGVSFVLLGIAALLFITGCIIVGTLDSPVSITKIKDPYIWLSGADEQFVKSLPQWGGY